MASLYIDFGYDDNVKRSINSAKRAINSRISDYVGIITTVNGTSSNTSNLGNANYFIRKKRDQLQDKYDKLTEFYNKTDSFNDFALEKDKAVANRIKEDSRDFYRRENIKTGFLYTVGCVISDGWKWIKGKAEAVWNLVSTGAKVLWDKIKEFYENNKYWINIVVDVVMVVAAAAALVAAIASGGAFAILFAVWGAAGAVFDTAFDVAAFKAHADGDEDLAEELSDKGMKDVFEHYGGDAGLALYYGLEVANFAYDIVDFGKNIKKAGENIKTAFDDSKKYSKIFSPESYKSVKKQIISQTIAKEVFGFDTFNYKSGGNLLKDGVYHKGKLLFKIPSKAINNTKKVIKFGKTWFSEGSILKKAVTTPSIGKMLVSGGENISEAWSNQIFRRGVKNTAKVVFFPYSMPLILMDR